MLSGSKSRYFVLSSSHIFGEIIARKICFETSTFYSWMKSRTKAPRCALCLGLITMFCSHIRMSCLMLEMWEDVSGTPAKTWNPVTLKAPWMFKVENESIARSPKQPCVTLEILCFVKVPKSPGFKPPKCDVWCPLFLQGSEYPCSQVPIRPKGWMTEVER